MYMFLESGSESGRVESGERKKWNVLSVDGVADMLEN